MSTVMFSIVQYAYWTVLTKRRNVTGHWAKFGPVYMLLVAAILVNVQPMCILVIGSWHEGITPQDCAKPDMHDNFPCTNIFWTPEATTSLYPNRWQGWVVTILCTYGGFALLITGVVQATGLLQKVQRTWNQARGQA